MEAGNASIIVKEAFTLPSIGIHPHDVTFENVTMESDKYICVRETSPHNSVVIIDMSQPMNHPSRRPITADSALMNPSFSILALKALLPGTTQDHLQIFNIDTRAKMKSYNMPEQVVFWKWISPKMLGLVTQTSVYHWFIRGDWEPMKVFDQTANLINNEITNYLCDPTEKWLVLIGIAPGSPESPQLVKGNMQIFSVDQQRSQALDAHAASLYLFKVAGNENPSTIISFATKTIKDGQNSSKLHVIELGAQRGKPSFTRKQADLLFPPDFEDDFPIAIQISQKYNLIYVITKHGLLFAFDLETASAVCRNKISQEPIILTTEASSVGGLYAINSRGQVLLATVNEATIFPFGSDQTIFSSVSGQEEKRYNELHLQLEKAMKEARNSKLETFEESERCRKAQLDAIEAIRMMKEAKSEYTEELKRRKEIELAFLKEKRDHQNMQSQRDDLLGELCRAIDQKLLLESKIVDTDKVVKELEEKIISSVNLLKIFKKERDEFKLERDNALQLGETSWTNSSLFFSYFSYLEIEEATSNFHPSLLIEEEEHVSIYKGTLRHTEVAIKMFQPHTLLGPSEYQHEVDILTKLRHPNLVTLIGACPEVCTLIYEYLPNGSLEDRLNCKDNTPPMPWKTRLRIAVELCSVLIFLHSCQPYNIVHSDLKPSNILLDANFVSKLTYLGSKVLKTIPNNNNTSSYRDAEIGEPSISSDIHSFGIILLCLLTGLPASGLTDEVKIALDNGDFIGLLDFSAGDWPYVEAEELAYLALKCTDLHPEEQANLRSDVWSVLEPMRDLYEGASSSSSIVEVEVAPPPLLLGNEEPPQPPSYFICPISQDVMTDPHVAADGFTYEAENLRAWFGTGHNTSPMTNLELSHTNLVPNLALRSAIQDWQEQQSGTG